MTLAMAPWGGQGYFCSPRSCCGGALAMAAPLGEFPSCCSCSIFPQNSPPCHVKMCSDLQEMKLQAHRHALELGLSRSWGGEGALHIPGVGTGNVPPLPEHPSAGTPPSHPSHSPRHSQFPLIQSNPCALRAGRGSWVPVRAQCWGCGDAVGWLGWDLGLMFTPPFRMALPGRKVSVEQAQASSSFTICSASSSSSSSCH